MVEQPEWLTLESGENLVWTGGPRLMRNASTVVGALVRSAIGVVIAWAVVNFLPPELAAELPASVPLEAVYLLAGLYVLLQIYGVVMAYLRTVNTDYVLTDRNVYKKTGVFSENTTRVGLDRIQTTELRKDFMGSRFDYGTVLVRSAGSSGADLVITDLDSPQEFRDELRRLVGEAGGGSDVQEPAPAALDSGTAETLVEEAERLRETAQRLEREVSES